MGDRYDDGRGLSMLIAGFGLGTLVGTVIGLLIAPKSGRELRADIAEYSKEYYDKAKDVGRGAVEKGRDYYDRGRERVREYSSKAGERIHEARENIGGAAERLRRAVNAGLEEIRGAAAEAPQQEA